MKNISNSKNILTSFVLVFILILMLTSAAFSQEKSAAELAVLGALPSEQIRSFDCIFIAAGTNDFGAVTNVGKVRVGDPYNFAPKVTTTCGGLDMIIRKIRSASPETKIIVITPMYRYKGWVEFPIPAVTNCDELKNRWDKTLADYRNAIAMTALKYPGVSVIDGKQLMTLEEAHSLDCTVDYLHPRSDFARTVIADRAVRLLQQYVK